MLLHTVTLLVCMCTQWLGSMFQVPVIDEVMLAVRNQVMSLLNHCFCQLAYRCRVRNLLGHVWSLLSDCAKVI